MKTYILIILNSLIALILQGIKEARDKAKLLTAEDYFLFISYRDFR
jgi:hypothetical protein